LIDQKCRPKKKEKHPEKKTKKNGKDEKYLKNLHVIFGVLRSTKNAENSMN
jgi:hypothetical protein